MNSDSDHGRNHTAYHNSKKGRILFAGHELLNNMKLYSELRKEGYDLQLAGNLEEMIALVKVDEKTDAVILDMDQQGEFPIPQMFRLKTVMQPSTALIMMADFNMRSMAMTLQTGCDAVLVKPVARNEVLKLLKRLKPETG